MIDIGLDPATGDIALVNKGAVLVRGVDQIAQNLAIRLRFFQQEWFLNMLAGLPYYQFFFVKDPNQIQVESFLLDEIANTRGVQEVTSFSSDYQGSTRRFSVRFSVKTLSQEEIELNQEIP